MGGNEIKSPFHQNNDPKDKTKATLEWLNKNKINVLEWPSQSPHLNPIEHLRWDLKIAAHWRSEEQKQFSHKEWAKISPSHCTTTHDSQLGETDPKRLTAVIAAKGASTRYWPKGLNTCPTSEFWFVHVFFRYSWHVTPFNYNSVTFDLFSYE